MYISMKQVSVLAMCSVMTVGCIPTAQAQLLGGGDGGGLLSGVTDTVNDTVSGLTGGGSDGGGSVGGLVSVGGSSNDGLANVNVGDTTVSVLPGSGDALESTGLGGAGVDLGSGGSSSLGVSLGGGPADEAIGLDVGNSRLSVNLGTDSGSDDDDDDDNNNNNGGDGGDGGDGSGTNIFVRIFGGGNDGIDGSRGSDGEDGIGRLEQLLALIRAEKWQRLAAFGCNVNVRALRVNNWLDRSERQRLPSVISQHAIDIGMLQSSLNTNPDLQCLLRQLGVRSNRVIAMDNTGGSVVLYVI